MKLKISKLLRFGRILTIDSWVLWFCQDSVESCGILKIRQILVLRFGRITVFKLLIPEYCDSAKIPSNLAESWRFGRFSYWDSAESQYFDYWFLSIVILPRFRRILRNLEDSAKSWLLILLRFRWILTISFYGTIISVNCPELKLTYCIKVLRGIFPFGMLSRTLTSANLLKKVAKLNTPSTAQ